MIQFENDPHNPSKSAAVPGPSWYVPPFKISQKQSAAQDSGSDDYNPNEVVPQSPSRGVFGKGTSKGKGKGKQITAKSGAGVKRKLEDETAKEFPAPISMYDPVSYPTYLFQPIPSKLKIDDLHKKLLIVKIEKVRKQGIFYERFNSLYAPLKDYLCSLPKEKMPESVVDHGDHVYTPYKE